MTITTDELRAAAHIPHDASATKALQLVQRLRRTINDTSALEDLVREAQAEGTSDVKLSMLLGRTPSVIRAAFPRNE